MTKKKINPFKKNKYEIMYKLINSFLAGALVFLGALTDGGVDEKTIFISLVAACVIAVGQFKDYFSGQEKEYSSKMVSVGGFI